MHCMRPKDYPNEYDILHLRKESKLMQCLYFLQSDMMAQDFKRTVARLQMDNDKLEKDLDTFAEKERSYLHQMKETEDRVRAEAHKLILQSSFAFHFRSIQNTKPSVSFNLIF